MTDCETQGAHIHGERSDTDSGQIACAGYETHATDTKAYPQRTISLPLPGSLAPSHARSEGCLGKCILIRHRGPILVSYVVEDATETS